MEVCKYCLEVCKNKCKEKIINRICPKCNIHYPKLYTFTRHLDRKTSCINEINKVSNMDNNEEVEEIFNMEEKEIISKDEILKKLMDRYDEKIKRFVIIESEYKNMIDKKDKEIEELRNNNKRIYEKNIMGVIYRKFEKEEIEVLINIVLCEKDENVINIVLQRIKEYRKSIYEYLMGEEFNLSIKKKIKVLNIMKDIYNDEEKKKIENMIDKLKKTDNMKNNKEEKEEYKCEKITTTLYF
jgi:hypothetical protein